MKKVKYISFIMIIIIISSSITFGVKDLKDESEYLEEYEIMDDMMEFILKNFKSEVLEEPITKKDLIEGAYRGILNELDPHSTYFNEEEYEYFLSDTKGEFGGIGIRVTKDKKHIKILAALDGTPGKEAGLKPGDYIIEVDGEDVVEVSLHKAVKLMRGEPNTKVSLTVIRDGEEKKIEIIRDIIEIDMVEYEVLESSIGYLRIKDFGDGVFEEVKIAMKDMKEQGIESLIIDLRNNPGGYLTDALNISDLFVDKNKKLLTVDYKVKDNKEYISRKEDQFTDEIVVLVNGYSASASEILAAAIKDNEEGILIGEKTFGKGTVQSMIKFSDGALKLTIAEYLTAGGKNINEIGIEPNFIVENIEEENFEYKKNNLAPLDINKNIFYDEKSLNVYALQQRLSLLGKDVNLDGNFGIETLKALKEFQLENNFEEKEYANSLVMKKLEKVVSDFDHEENDLQLKEAIKRLKK